MRVKRVYNEPFSKAKPFMATKVEFEDTPNQVYNYGWIPSLKEIAVILAQISIAEEENKIEHPERIKDYQKTRLEGQ